MNDGKVAIHRYCRQGQGRDIHANTPADWLDPTERRPENPTTNDGVEGRERNQQAHQKIRHGKIRDEDVGRSLEDLAACHHEDHQSISGHTDQEGDAVYEDDGDEKPRVVREEIWRSRERHVECAVGDKIRWNGHLCRLVL